MASEVTKRLTLATVLGLGWKSCAITAPLLPDALEPWAEPSSVHRGRSASHRSPRAPPTVGAKPIEQRLTTPALQVEARLPPGAEHLPGLIATREHRVNQTWQPEPKKGRVGDGFTRTVTLAAPDVPGMVFPPLPLARGEGLAVYPKAPVVQDHAERGNFTGTRIETVTYICERPGQFTLPALVIPWWDLKNQKLMQVTLPDVTLDVEPTPMSSGGAAASATIEDFLVHNPEADLRHQVEALQAFILGRGTHWNGQALADALRRARQQLMQRKTTADEVRLPALNPP
jgi:hypothetical protein